MDFGIDAYLDIPFSLACRDEPIELNLLDHFELLEDIRFKIPEPSQTGIPIDGKNAVINFELAALDPVRRLQPFAPPPRLHYGTWWRSITRRLFRQQSGNNRYLEWPSNRK
jgi:hypothetical protein